MKSYSIQWSWDIRAIFIWKSVQQDFCKLAWPFTPAVYLLFLETNFIGLSRSIQKTYWFNSSNKCLEKLTNLLLFTYLKSFFVFDTFYVLLMTKLKTFGISCNIYIQTHVSSQNINIPSRKNLTIQVSMRYHVHLYIASYHPNWCTL